MRDDRLELPAYATLLLLMADASLSGETAERCRKIIATGAVDWGRFVDAAGRHKLLPLVSRHLQEHRLDRGDTGDGSQGLPYFWLYPYTYLGNRNRNLALADEFAKVFAGLDRAGVRYAVRKGFVLAERYHDIGARRINDLDILVERPDAPAAHEVLGELAYVQGKISKTSERVEPFDRETQLFWRINLSNQLPYVKPGNRPDIPVFNVDICHHLFQHNLGIDAPTGEFLDRREAMVLCGRPSWALSLTDQVLDLCSHLHKEATGLMFVAGGIDLQISKFLDLALTCRVMDDRHWAHFRRVVTGYGAERVAYYSLHFTDLLYPGVVPAAVLDALRPADLTYLDVVGERDGNPTTLTVPFPDRLFSTERAVADSTVPHR